MTRRDGRSPARRRTMCPPVAWPIRPSATFTTNMAPMEIATPDRSFFLEEFRRITIVLAIDDVLCEEMPRDDTPGDAGNDSTKTDLAVLGRVVRDLVANETRVVLVVSEETVAAATDAIAPITELVGTDAQRLPDNLDDDLGGNGSGAFFSALWTALAENRTAVVSAEECLAGSARLAARLGVTKLVLATRLAGWGDPVRNLVTLAELTEEAGSPQDPAADTDLVGRSVADAVTVALEGGVNSVNVCRLAALEEELMTFAGAGTLFTTTDFLEARPFRIDELSTVEDFVRRGVREGFLRARSRDEVGELMATGLGVHVVGSGHLAGIGALETRRYTPDRLGEISCLYAVERFTGEGVGQRLVTALVNRASDAGLRAVFACTVAEEAVRFFERCGFRVVEHDDVPGEKWDGYDPDRRSAVRCLWLDL